ncbi:Mov34/MPN/PAD-1 family protein [Mesorhizobium sp. ANAO-SY3R2]|uniref:Mov34/MPN/PAD-1 family protein n=1 Tax=Mesorhizobium sp. ANAO-SY3R2 TaxID=3166644 RepID=UPI00366C28CD
MLDADVHAASADARFRVTVESGAMRLVLAKARAAGDRETGGILIGHIDSNGRAVVQEATGKPRGSIFGWYTFVRKTRGLASLLKTRWQESQHYLGEWHSHPGALPTPSEQDRATMRAIARDDGYCCPEPILLIVGTRNDSTEISITVFPRNEQSVLLR